MIRLTVPSTVLSALSRAAESGCDTVCDILADSRDTHTLACLGAGGKYDGKFHILNRWKNVKINLTQNFKGNQSYPGKCLAMKV